MYLFVHHSDMRIPDNTTLNYLLKNNIEFQPIFIGTPEQLDNSNNYKSDNAIHFMVQSLLELNAEYKKYGLTLLFYYGNTLNVIEELVINNDNIIGIANNRDYSPFAIQRDDAVERLAKKYGIKYLSFEDKLLNPVEKILTGQGHEYTKFTPYFNNANKNEVIKPLDLSSNIKNSKNRILKCKYEITIDFLVNKVQQISLNITINGGRNNALNILKNIQNFDNYNDERNIPMISTTQLSPYLKFGCISVRELYYAILDKLGIESELIKQLYWRDFYHMILYYYGSYDVPISITKDSFNNIYWKEDEESYIKWTQGMTGCPIVDAGMREMNTTGFMHNRLRMIVASYLIFYLHIDWRKGMLYFSKKLVDADWANNLGNWQWTAGVEKWSNDYYRVFSMQSQVERFDSECVYIKKWVPELQEVTNKDIINWDVQYIKYIGKVHYPKPIILNNKLARAKGIELYKNAIKKK